MFIVVATEDTAHYAEVEVVTQNQLAGTEVFLTRLRRGQYFGQKFFLTRRAVSYIEFHLSYLKIVIFLCYFQRAILIRTREVQQFVYRQILHVMFKSERLLRNISKNGQPSDTYY